MKKEYSLNDLLKRHINLVIIASKKLGYNFKKHEPDKEKLKQQIKKAVKLAHKWGDEEKWVCIKPCKELKYHDTTEYIKVKP